MPGAAHWQGHADNTVEHGIERCERKRLSQRCTSSHAWEREEIRHKKIRKTVNDINKPGKQGDLVAELYWWQTYVNSLSMGKCCLCVSAGSQSGGMWDRLVPIIFFDVEDET